MAPQIMSAQQQVKWAVGPAKADLGTVGEVDIPEGYRLTDAVGARILLERMKSAAPAGTVGLLTPESGDWWVILQYSNLGYVQPAAIKRINADTIISGVRAKVEGENKVRARQGAAPMTAVTWDLAPEFDATHDSLSYAVQIEYGTDKVTKPIVHFFGRNGVLSGTVAVVKQNAAPDKAALKELFKQISFKAEQRYADFQAGDKVSSLEIYQMITGDEQIPVQPKTGLAGFFEKYKRWLLSGLAVCALAVVSYLVTKEIRSLSPQRPSLAAGTANNGAIKRRSTKVSDSAARRRAFDYQKFYSDMMLQVSTRSYTGLVVNHQEEPVEEAGQPVSPTPAPTASIADARGAASELIARQKDFIEEQRRLMQQQTKLIEERSKLIEEKNQLLAKQSEMIENHLL